MVTNDAMRAFSEFYYEQQRTIVKSMIWNAGLTGVGALISGGPLAALTGAVGVAGGTAVPEGFYLIYQLHQYQRNVLAPQISSAVTGCEEQVKGL